MEVILGYVQIQGHPGIHKTLAQGRERLGEEKRGGGGRGGGEMKGRVAKQTQSFTGFSGEHTSHDANESLSALQPVSSS